MPGFFRSLGSRLNVRGRTEVFDRPPSNHPLADVLVVCTANICRSPMAEGLLGSMLKLRGSPLSVTSAGFLEQEGRLVDGLSVRAVGSHGIDIAKHRSSRMSLDQLEAAKLILCMTTEHRRKVVGFRLAFYQKTFTLHEFVRRSIDLQLGAGNETFPGWLLRLHEGRTGNELLTDDEQISVGDPHGHDLDAHQRTAQVLSVLCSQVSELLAPGQPLCTE